MQTVLRGTFGRFALCAAAALLGLAALATSARADTVDSENGDPITVNDFAAATPSPSQVDIQGADGEIETIQVLLRMTHTSPDDLDIALVSPEGDSEILMSDACGPGDLADGEFIFAASLGPVPTMPDSGPCPPGSYAGSNYAPIDTWADIPGGNPTTANLANFLGENPNGTWGLHVVDDATTDTGSIATWMIRVSTTTGEIVIPGTGSTGIGNPYPSTKTFDTPPGEVITDVNLRMDDFNHMNMDDVDMVLQGPGGQTTIVTSDACGGTELHNRTWIFDDEATEQFEDNNPDGCTSPSPSSVRPVEFGSIESLPAPAPQRPYGSQLSVFDGLQGGEWRLFVNDDVGDDTGFLDSWSVELTTRPAADTGFTNTSAQGAEGKAITFAVMRSESGSLGPAAVDVSIVPGSAGLADLVAPTGTLEFARGETTKTIEVQIEDDGDAERTETFRIALSSPDGDARLADAGEAEVTIAPSDLPPNEFSFGKPVKRRNGTAVLPVAVPAAGALTATNQKIKPASADAPGEGTVDLLLKPSKQAKKQLKNGKKVRVAVEVAFTPTGGERAAKSATVVLKRKGK